MMTRSRSIEVMRFPLAEPDTRIEIGVDHVRHQGEQDVAEGHEDDDRLNDREVGPEDRLEGEESDAVQGKDGFDDHRAAEKETQGDRGQRYNREYGVAQSVLEQDGAGGKALG